MSCDNCRETLRIDDIEPDCFNGSCRVPELNEAGSRAIEIRQKLAVLSELGVGTEILRMYEADFDDLDLIAVIEEQIREHRKERD